VKEVFKIPIRHNQKRISPYQIIAKMPRLENKRKDIEICKRKTVIYLQRQTLQNYLRPLSRNSKSQESKK
jgi:hypothetical protein